MVASTYPIQMLRIIAKSILCLFLPYLNNRPYQTVQLDDIEIQSCLNIIQGRSSLYQVATLPICSFMKDLMVLNENKYSFLKWNAYELLLIMKGKCEDYVVEDSFDKLMWLLTSSSESPALEKRGSATMGN